jgi:hypothetical protein
MQIRNPLAGRGTRRKSDEQWDRLQQAVSTAQRDLATANEQIATLTAERDEARSNSDKHLHLWRCADREVQRLRFLLGEDAKLPATQVPAPVDTGIRDTPLANAETQPVDVQELREAVGEGDTQVLPVVSPVVAVEPTPRVTWGVTPVLPLQVKAGPGSADPTEVLPAVSRRAKTNVATALTTND